MADSRQDPPGPGLGLPTEVPRRGTPRLRKLLRELHHQTWELELLISGLVAFGLLQLPGPLNQIQRLAWAQSPATGGILGTLSLTYLKLAIYTLIVAFGVHLVVRALWVGLVGLDSVFPRGMRFDQLDAGPIMEELTRTRIPSVRQLIVRTDALASVIFAVAFAVGFVFLAAIPTAIILLLAGFGVAALLPGQVDEMRVFWSAWGAFMVLAVVPALTDRFLGARLGRNGRAWRLLRGLLRLLVEISGARIYSPIFNTLQGHVGRFRAQALLLGGILLMGFLYMGYDLLAVNGRAALASSPWLPSTPSPVAALADSYDELRDPSRGRIDLPSIPERVARGTFVPLFVPWVPDRVESVLDDACPDAPRLGNPIVRLRRSLRADSAGRDHLDRSARTAACVGTLWAVQLDGEPVAVDPVFSIHPGTRMRGLLWMIPLEGLALDRHLLEVWGPMDPDRLADPGSPAAGYENGGGPRYHPIPFWRGGNTQD